MVKPLAQNESEPIFEKINENSIKFSKTREKCEN